MSAIEKSGVIKYKDANGQVYLMLPVTTADRVDGAVSYYEQELTNEEKAQVRNNIGAVSNEAVATLGLNFANPEGYAFDFRGEWVAGTTYKQKNHTTPLVVYEGNYYYLNLPAEAGAKNESTSSTFNEAEWTLLIDNTSSDSENGGSTGGSGSDVVPIIDVYELPKTDIQENSAYRLFAPKLIRSVYDTNHTVRSVDGLPSTGENVIDSDGNYFIYFNLQNGTPYVYINSATASSLGVPSNWYDLATAAPLAGLNYAGVITGRSQASLTDDTKYYILNDGDYTLYMYNVNTNKWGRIQFACMPGGGPHSGVIGAYWCSATGLASFAQGFSRASGDYSSAMGLGSIAKGKSSHAVGETVYAYSDNQTAQGKYNIEDSNDEYAYILGNGSNATNKSNAHTIDWEGNAWFSGDVYVGSTSGTNKDDGSKKLATEEYVNNAVANGGGSGGSTSPGASVQSDWNQNDSAADDYIKNRPFYTADGHIFFDDDITTAVEIDEETGEESILYSSMGDGIIESYAEKVGETFDVTFNGETYSCVLQKPVENVDMYVLGNLALNSDPNEEGSEELNTGEPFLINIMNLSSTTINIIYTAEAGTHHLTIATDGTTIYKLDKKYLPKISASEIAYDDTNTQFGADNIQAAMKKLSENIDNSNGGSGLPTVSTSDNGKFLRVVNGAWAAVEIPSAEGVSF